MDPLKSPKSRNTQRYPSRMPEGSTFYERIIPILLVVMGVAMVALVLVAVGVLTGLVHF